MRAFVSRLLDIGSKLRIEKFGIAKLTLAAIGCVSVSNMALAQGAGTPAGTAIRNSAMIEFTRTTGMVETVVSNETVAVVAPAPSRSTIAILRAAEAPGTGTPSTAGPTQCLSGGNFIASPQPRLANGVTVNPVQPIELQGAQSVHGGEAVFVQLTDNDRNRDGQVVDTVDVQLTSQLGDVETIRLSETGINTGTFVGYIQTSAANAVQNDCVLQVERNGNIGTQYADPNNSQDTASATALVDPYGIVFDSQTGQPVDGARVRLLNANTGLPATVFGDDGVSTYPSEMTTGQPVTDAGGTVYVLPPGMFRFPLVASGQYRLVVEPATHSFPSTRSIADIQASLGNGFNLNAGSYGNAFPVIGPPAVAVDVPVDLIGTGLFLRKTTTTTIAAPGDFVQYSVSAQNTSTAGGLQDIRVTDTLPMGMRYREGSTRIQGVVAADPTIADDGRTLTFSLGNLAATQAVTFTYVTEITVQARGKQLTNGARARALNGLESNPAQATIRLREELFRDAAVIMGRVVTGSCDKNANELPGVAGVRVYLEDGRYSVTDEDGKYHFEGVKPGSHVVQVDAVSIPGEFEPLLCKDRVRNAGRGYSQFADVRGGALWRADFWLKHREPPAGAASLKLRSTLSGDLDVQHTVSFGASGNDLSNGNLMVVLPTGLKYVPNSARLDGAATAEPTISDDLLIFKVGAIKADTQRELGLATHAVEEAAGALIVKAVAVFDSPSQKSLRTEPVENRLSRGAVTLEKASYRFSPQFAVLKAELDARDRAKLDALIEEWRGVRNLRITAIGHTDKKPISGSNSKLFADNYALSHARANAVADYLRSALQLGEEQVQVSGKGPDELLEQGDDEASHARNRRVELAISGMRVAAAGKLSIQQPQATSPMVSTQGVLAGVQKPSAAAPKTAVQTQGSAAADNFVEQLSAGIAWLAPTENELQAISSIKVAIQHHAGQTVELRLNDAPVSALNFDGVTTNGAKTVSVSRWRGVDIKDGDNFLVAVVRNADGSEAQRLERTVRFANSAVRAELVKEESKLTADGTTKPVIVLRLFDASGKPARPGTQGAFSVDPPYRSWWEVETMRENQVGIVGPREPLFQVDDDGLARLELEPTTQTGSVLVRLRFNERQTQELRAWLAPQTRDWILVGLAEGTAAHKSISDNMEAATAADLEEGYSDDGRVAFFAKGRIKGDFLLTLAYDSERERETDERRIGQVIEPNRYYTVYGDNSEQRFEAPSSEKLFVKLERQQFMAMFGDYDTGLTVTELGRYSRTLTGVRSDYAGERFGYTLFGANTDQGLVKDELRGDGTSGLYRLSNGNLIINSDKLRIEVRDRFRSEVIVESRTLTRFIDYTIDYLGGTIFFKEPIPSRDPNFNPVYIIAEYEVLQGAKEEVVAGGRASYKFGNTAEVGASYVTEGSAAGDTRVAATDLKVNFTDSTQLRVEAARSESDNSLRAEEADAYLTELRHVSDRVEATAYFREQDGGFGVGQQLSTETGTRKFGIDGRVKITENWSIEAEAQKQALLESTAERELASAEVRRHTDTSTVGIGVRHVADSGLPIGDAESQQAFANGSLQLLNDKLTLKAGQDVSLSGSSESVDYPSRSLLGADYKFTPDTAVFAEYEHADGSQFDSDMVRIGLRASPWARARFTSSANRQFSEYGPRTFANYGLTQGWQINDKWSMDFGVDQSRTIAGNDFVEANGVSPFNRNVPIASGTTIVGAGNEDFLASSIAAMYRSELWTMTARVEHRDADSEQRWSWISGFYREPVRGHAFSMATQYLSSDRGTAGDSTIADLRLAWAYRPVESRWIILDRFDVKYDTRDDATLEYKSARYVNNLNANLQLNTRTQLGLQLGGRYVVSSFDGESYSGASSLIGFDVRRDLNHRFDIGLHGTRLDSWNSNVSDTAVGFDVGVTIAKNMWISIGYNYIGFDDQDFSASRYTAQGAFIKFRIKADQDTFKDLNLSALRPNAKK